MRRDALFPTGIPLSSLYLRSRSSRGEPKRDGQMRDALRLVGEKRIVSRVCSACEEEIKGEYIHTYTAVCM